MNDLAKKAAAAGIAAVAAIAIACLAKQALAPHEDAAGPAPEAPIEQEAAAPAVQRPGTADSEETPGANAAEQAMPAEMNEGEWSKAATPAATFGALSGCVWESADGRSSVEIVTGRVSERRGTEENAFKSTLKESWTCADGRSAALLEAESAEGGARTAVWIVVDAADIEGRSYMIESDQFEFAKKYYDTYGG